MRTPAREQIAIGHRASSAALMVAAIFDGFDARVCGSYRGHYRAFFV
jgi:hypothetical protein